MTPNDRAILGGFIFALALAILGMMERKPKPPTSLPLEDVQ